MDGWFSLKVPSVSENIAVVEESLVEALENSGFSENDVFAVRLALDEALSNAIKHGNRYDAKKKVSVRYRLDTSSITIVVGDEGGGFDYHHLPDPTAPERLELPSGRGLLLMHSYMDSVTFNEKGSEVTMVKRRGVEKCAQ